LDPVREAADRVVAIQMRYAQQGIGLAQAAMAGVATLEPWRHHPRADIIDHRNASQFYYHAHESSRSPADEHGHFHLFSRLSGRADHEKSTGQAGWSAGSSEPDSAEGFVHLVALSLDARGLPLRWFVTNRWVTGGRWADAGAVIAALARFHPQARGRLAPVGEWLSAMIVLYGQTIAALLRRRDALVARRTAGVDPKAFFEDRSVDVITEHRIFLGRRLASVAGSARASMMILKGEHP